MDSIQRTLLALEGYNELGMPADAIGELSRLPVHVRLRAETLEIHIHLLIRLKRFRHCLRVARMLCAVQRESGSGYIHLAYCLHELNRTWDAKAALLAGPESLTREATFHYNLACYESVLGNVETARAYLNVSFSMDAKFRSMAKEDPDLQAVFADEN